MQVENKNRPLIVTATTVAGVGAGVTAAHYLPLVNEKGVANSDKFVKEVANEMTGNKLYNLVTGASAQDYLHTLEKGNGVTEAQTDKFFNRFGDFLEVKKELFVDKNAEQLKGKALVRKLQEVVAGKIAENGEVKFAEDGKTFNLLANTTDEQAKSLIKDGFDKRGKLVKAGTTIDEQGHRALKAAMKTIKNERMVKGGIIAGLVALAASIVTTCPKD